MAQRTRSTKLDTRSARLKLPMAKKPIFVKVSPGVALGYRRTQSNGTWVARVADGKGGNWTKAFATADDFEEANDTTVLDFWKAQDRARTLGRANRSGEEDDGKPVTVDKALARYEVDLESRHGDIYNIARVRIHLPDTLAHKPVALLVDRDLRKWRDGLVRDMAPASVNRTMTVIRAALNAVADRDQRITNRQSWKIGLKAIPNSYVSRNVILDDSSIRAIITEACRESAEFGLLVEVAAVTGARVSQVARLKVHDLQTDRADLRLMMPVSRKGRGQKKITERPVPIQAPLATRLRLSAADKASDALLLVRPNGDPWRGSSHNEPFRRVVKRAGQDSDEVTIYALRHSSIVRQILANVPIRVVAALHDTSVGEIEKTYSKYIADHSDALARPALLDTTVAPPADNVIPIKRT